MMKKKLFLLFLIVLQTIDCKSTAHKKKSHKHESHDQGRSGSTEAAPEASNGDTCGLRRTDTKAKSKKKVLGAKGMGRIVGGVGAEPFEFPWQVSLQVYMKNRKQIINYCGGAIINEHWILTAGHCTYPYLGKEKTILIKATSYWNRDYKTPNYTVDHFVIHPEYDKQWQENDIALIRTEEKIHFKTNNKKQYEVNSICLPEKDSEVSGTLTVSGFGQIGAKESHSDYLQKLDVPLYDQNNCSEAFMNVKVNHLKFCAGGEGGHDSCTGDSGGPLVKMNGDRVEVVGIVSFGLPCAVKDYPTVFTKVSKYVDWINKHANGSK